MLSNVDLKWPTTLLRHLNKIMFDVVPFLEARRKEVKRLDLDFVLTAILLNEISTTNTDILNWKK